MKRREWIQACAALTLVASGATQAQVINLNDAINKAGRQRMLSQRMGKAYLALVQHVEVKLAQSVLDRSIALFDRQLVELKSFAAQPELRGTYVALESAWSDYKGALVGSAPSRAGVAAVMSNATTVLALAHKGTQQYEALLNKPVGKLVNVAGRQRMLSQRMATFYLASILQFDPAAAHAEIMKARGEFVNGLEVLRNAPEASDSIKDELQLADGQWLLFDNAISRTGASNTTKPQSDVFVTSENLLTVMDRVTGLYANLQGAA